MNQRKFFRESFLGLFKQRILFFLALPLLGACNVFGGREVLQDDPGIVPLELRVPLS